VGSDHYDSCLGLAWVTVSGFSWTLGLMAREGPERVWKASDEDLVRWGVAPAAAGRFVERRRRFELDRILSDLGRTGMSFIPFASEHYPRETNRLEHPPAGLFVLCSAATWGRVLTSARVAVVGTRKMTGYGRQVTEAFSGAFARNGVAVVSGLALGVDGCAHEAALDAGGLTVAVLGCGTDLVYPRCHRALYERIALRGAVVSELPPGTSPTRWNFPRRNRLLAALGDAALVTEGSRRSGAMQTAEWTLRLGGPVFAIPGQVGAETSEGCNRLVYDGATPALEPCVTVEDFLLQTRIERGARRPGPLGASHERDGGSVSGGGAVGSGMPRAAEGWSRLEDDVVGLLGRDPWSVDDLVERLQVPVRALAVALSRLELAGVVRRTAPGLYIRAP